MIDDFVIDALKKISAYRSGNGDYYHYTLDEKLPLEVRQLITRLDTDYHDMLHTARGVVKKLGIRNAHVKCVKPND